MAHRFALWTLLMLLAATAPWTTARAQEGDDACQMECEKRQQECIDACGDYDDPIECESDCRNDTWVCQNDCQ